MKDKWIKCSERLPEHRERVIVCLKEDVSSPLGKCTIYESYTAYLDSDGKWNLIYPGYCYKIDTEGLTATHWMPLSLPANFDE